MLKIAVATSDGISIDVHFGQATSFHIFDVAEDGTYHLLEQRVILSGIVDGRHAGATIEQLTDVNVILVNRIGDGPIRELEERGIKVFALDGSLDRALTTYGKRRKFLMKTNPGVPRHQGIAHSGCGGCSSHGDCTSIPREGERRGAACSALLLRPVVCVRSNARIIPESMPDEPTPGGPMPGGPRPAPTSWGAGKRDNRRRWPWLGMKEKLLP